MRIGLSVALLSVALMTSARLIGLSYADSVCVSGGIDASGNRIPCMTVEPTIVEPQDEEIVFDDPGPSIPDPAPAANEFDLALSAGVKAFNERRYGDALSHFEAALAADPNSEVAKTWWNSAQGSLYFIEADAAMRRGDYDEGSRLYRLGLGLFPEAWKTIGEKYYNWLGNAAYDRDDWEAAIAHYDSGLQYAPNSSTLKRNSLLAKANLAKREGNWEQAKGFYDDLLRLFPDDAAIRQSSAYVDSMMTRQATQQAAAKVVDKALGQILAKLGDGSGSPSGDGPLTSDIWSEVDRETGVGLARIMASKWTPPQLETPEVKDVHERIDRLAAAMQRTDALLKGTSDAAQRQVLAKKLKRQAYQFSSLAKEYEARSGTVYGQ